MKSQTLQTKNINHKTRYQAGISLLEAIIGVAILAIVASFVTGLAGGAFSGTSTVKSGNETKALIAGTKSATGGTANYGTASLNTGLIAGGLVPNTLSVSGSTITNSFGGTVTVTGATNNFTIAETLIPKDVCVKKLTTLDPGVLSVVVNTGTSTSPPININSAAGLCNAATNTITYTAS